MCRDASPCIVYRGAEQCKPVSHPLEDAMAALIKIVLRLVASIVTSCLNEWDFSCMFCQADTSVCLASQVMLGHTQIIRCFRYTTCHHRPPTMKC